MTFQLIENCLLKSGAGKALPLRNNTAAFEECNLEIGQCRGDLRRKHFCFFKRVLYGSDAASPIFNNESFSRIGGRFKNSGKELVAAGCYPRLSYVFQRYAAIKPAGI